MTERQDPNSPPSEGPSETADAPDEIGGVPTEDVDSPTRLRTRTAEKREDIRAHLARILAYLFAAIVIALFVSSVLGGQQWTRVQEFSQIAFGVVAGVVGTIIGFYFGSQR